MANDLLSLLLIGVALAGATDDQAPKPRIEISGQIYMPDGKTTGASRLVEMTTAPQVWYVYTGKTLCEARTVSTEKPVVAGNGWKLELKASPAETAKGAMSVTATWQRLWEGGKAISQISAGTRVLTLQPGSPVPLDTIDGAARRMTAATLTRLRTWKPGDPVPAEFALDPVVSEDVEKIAASRHQWERLKVESGFGANHPLMVPLDSSIQSTQSHLDSRVKALIDGAISGAPMGNAAAADGCAALSMNLQLNALAPSATAKVTETELWLVHRDPSGKETTQRQVIRSRESNGEFYFDDLKIDTERGPLTIEVYGALGLPTQPAGSPMWLTLSASRRYVTGRESGFAWKTKEGRSNYAQAIAPNEVIAFQFTPLPDDEGALVGHRISLRVRVQVLQ
ncbi:MAG: hypothetical protein IT162_19315 [Bryobacterales bacterium]|jgi:hypothetical protein|nr:hypothetical protein [Caldilineaceae bacterium]MCC6539707.1 hypothetical protein [Bryobacterales bacterium]